MTTPQAGNLDAYLEARIDRQPGDDGCWLWTLKPDREGYGVANWAGRTHRAHRLAYSHWVGPIPDGAELDHTCEIHACVRPSHLDPVTGLVNLERKHLRRGETPERARELALLDQQMYARQSEKRRADTAARSAAADVAQSVGVRVGTRLRRSTSKAGVIWRVVAITAYGGEPWLTVTSERTGYEDRMRLGDLAVASIIT